LFAGLGKGGHFETVTLYIRKSGGSINTSSAEPYLVYTFKMVYVTSMDWSGSAGDDAPTETVTFAFGALQIAYTPQAKSGSGPATKPILGTWNVVKNNDSLAMP
jgi:type VI secretion system secreted protein Hcp